MAEQTPAQPVNVRAAHEVGSHLLWAALVAGIVACGIPFLSGLVGGWTPARLIAYGALALVYIAATQATVIPALKALCLNHTGAYLTLMGIVCCALQAISGDALVQPIAFTVPFVSAAIWYDARMTATVGAAYLLLMALGLGISGRSDPAAIAFPVASYGALMVFMYNSTRLIIRESSARERADQLAADLQRERAYLQQLTDVNATLARDLDLAPVLEHVAEAAQTLAHAQHVRLWLRSDDQGSTASTVRLALQRPPTHSIAGDGNSTSAPPLDVARIADDTLVIPLLAKGRAIGILDLRVPSHAPFSAADVRRLQPFADAAALAIENAHLYQQSQLSATLAERNRLARELHDTIAQGLTAVTMHLEAAQRSFDRDPTRTRQRMSRAHDLARATLDDVRRSVWMLASPLIDGASLDTALADLTQRFGARTGIVATYHQEGQLPQLDHAVATQTARIVQEALQNVEKHAQAARVAVEVRADEEVLEVSVADDGIGFDAASNQATDRPTGFGLHSLHERARLAGGMLRIQSAPGAGTRIELLLPVARSTRGS